MLDGYKFIFRTDTSRLMYSNVQEATEYSCQKEKANKFRSVFLLSLFHNFSSGRRWDFALRVAIYYPVNIALLSIASISNGNGSWRHLARHRSFLCVWVNLRGICHEVRSYGSKNGRWHSKGLKKLIRERVGKYICLDFCIF